MFIVWIRRLLGTKLPCAEAIKYLLQHSSFALEHSAVVLLEKCAQIVLLDSMKAVLPGNPRSRLQGLASGYWDSRHINVSTEPTQPILASFELD